MKLTFRVSNKTYRIEELIASDWSIKINKNSFGTFMHISSESLNLSIDTNLTSADFLLNHVFGENKLEMDGIKIVSLHNQSDLTFTGKEFITAEQFIYDSREIILVEPYELILDKIYETKDKKLYIYLGNSEIFSGIFRDDSIFLMI